MRSRVKDELKENKSDLVIHGATLKSSQSNLILYEGQLDALKEKISKKKEELTDKLTLDIENKKIEVSTALAAKTQYKDTLDAQSKLNSAAQEEVSKISLEIRDLTNRLAIYAKNRCPHCLNDLHSDSSIEIKEKIESKITKLKDSLQEKKKIADSINEALTSLLLDRSDIDSEYFNKKAELSSLEKSLEAAQENTGSDEILSISGIIDNLNAQIIEDTQAITALTSSRSIALSLDDLLSENGIKRDMIDRIIPTLNARILEISEKLEFKFSFEFDNEFDPHITYLGMQISPESLSSGQRKKMNLIVLLAFIEIIKMKHTTMNVMFLDEIFSSLDKTNVYRAISILKEYSTRYNMTIFVVSHESLPEELFDNRICVTQNDHFSEMEIIKI
jgi:DNA repair exonuclease SbcCD ATPase subunit